MTTLREAATAALEALESWARLAPDLALPEYDDAITALRAALAEPVQKPVAKYSDIVSDGGLDPRNRYDTAPPQRKPLRTVIYACPICAASLERQE